MYDGYYNQDKSEIVCDPIPVRNNPESETKINRLNPRYLFIDPESSFGRSFYHDLLMEQQEQM